MEIFGDFRYFALRVFSTDKVIKSVFLDPNNAHFDRFGELLSTIATAKAAK
jgi:hypothetical protein